MVKPPVQLKVLQQRLLWFFGSLAIIGLSAGYYFQSPTYAVIGLLGVGVVIGGVIRIILDRRHLNKK
jgi:hypothetical protein